MKIKINGENYSVSDGLSAFDAAKAAGIELSRDIIAAEINGKTSDLTMIVKDGDEVKLLTFADEGGAHTFRHTASHVLAAAVKRLYPNTKLTIGPAIENGFYYDFDSDTTFTPDVLDKIEAEMAKVVKENAKLEKYTLPRAEALEFMKDEPYKVELINDLPEDAEISFYKMGDFTDLCAGPHLFSTGAIKAFNFFLNNLWII